MSQTPPSNHLKLKMIFFLENILLMIAMATLFTGCQRAEPETFLFRDGFTGSAIIIQDRPDGAPATVEDGRRIYNIPQDGVLITQATQNTGTVDEKFFYVLADGTRREIVEREFSTLADTPQNRADTTVIVVGGGAGSIGADEIPYRDFGIGTRAQILDAERLDPMAILDQQGISYK